MIMSRGEREREREGLEKGFGKQTFSAALNRLNLDEQLKVTSFLRTGFFQLSLFPNVPT
jgi:hypothetical protein